MAWDPTVLRKYNTTGHFRLLNQVRSELKDNPLVRPKQGQSVGEANRSKSLIRALEGRSYGSRARRSVSTPMPADQPIDVVQQPMAADPRRIEPAAPDLDGDDFDGSASASFRERLNAIEMR
ncbi:MAG: hypothetical protein NTW02_00460 [Cyanobium sp. LacPavin_0920_WC12_MAG_62_9]|jgi:hypothetical protein|nr:hypothetical protein [Cyanobium sp. LacPavin_0920_WC12_MAG_62_9]